jgi:hypothetical protein
MRAINIDNPILNSYLSDLSADYNPTQASPLVLTVRSNNSFQANDLVVYGNPTEELTELKKLNSVSSVDTFNLPSALNFAHNKGTPVYKSLWDQVSIEANYGSGFSEITKSPIQWDSTKNQTTYFDGNGTNTTSYRFRFYNTVTATYSEYSPTLTGASFTKFQMGYIIREARRIAGDKEGKILTTDECLRALTRAKNIVRAHNARYWFWKVNGYQQSLIDATTVIPATATNSVYSLSAITDLGIIDLINYRYVQGGTDFIWTLRRKSDIELLEYTRNRNRPSFDFPHFFRILPPDANSSKGYFEIEYAIKNSNLGNFYIDYYKEESDYTTVASTTSIIIPEILQDYLIAIIYETKGNQTQADKYYNLFTGPQSRKKTNDIEDLSGIALLDELDRQYKVSQGQPRQLWRFRGQKAISKLYGNRTVMSPDYIRENYFDGPE